MNQVEALNKLGFTKYEAQVFLAIMKFKSLDALDIAVKSGVPQPRVYESMEKLISLEIVDKLPIGKKSIYQVKSKDIVEKRIEALVHEFTSSGNAILANIDEEFGTGQGSEIPFVGIAGKENLIEYLSSTILDARDSVTLFLPKELVEGHVVDSLRVANKKATVKVICRDTIHANELSSKLPHECIHILTSPVFDNIKKVVGMIRNFLPKDQHESFSLEIIEKIGENSSDLVGIALFDAQKSFFLIPIPVGVPSAIIATLPEMLNFHFNVLEEILKSSKEYESTD